MKTRLTHSRQLASIAAMLGVYVIIATIGNIANPTTALSADKQCTLTDSQRTLLDNGAQGDVAGVRVLDEAIDLSEISFKNTDGEQQSIASFAGQKLFFHLWATWCPPCRDEMPLIEDMHTKYKDKGLAVLPVSIDLGDDQLPKHFYEQTGLKELPFYHDGTMEAFNGLRKKAIALGMPTTLLVDEKGCGLAVLSGPAHWNSPDAYALIDTFLKSENTN